MQIVRAILWGLLLAAFLVFSVNNWAPIELKIWEGIILETKTPAVAVIAFLLGLVPMWLIHRGAVWRFRRRIRSLENMAQSVAVAAPVAGPASSPDHSHPAPAAGTAAAGTDPSHPSPEQL